MLLALTGCAPRPLLERAIRARGPLAGVVRTAEATVVAGFPGTFRWRSAYHLPDRWAWTLFTGGEPNHYAFDGRVARAFVGRREVAADAGPDAALRSHARLMTVVHLDALRLPGVVVAPLPPGELPPGATAGLAVVLPDDGARYRLGFDADLLLVSADGPIALPPFGTGSVSIRFTDFRLVAGRRLHFHARYTFRDAPLAEERTLAVCPDPPGLDAAAFAVPATLPDCPPP
jgi:hypothetical protein